MAASYFFTDFFRQQLFANQAIMGPTQPIRLCFFSNAPSLSGDVSKWVGVKTKAELTALPGWVEASGIAGYPLTLTVPVSTRSGVAGKIGNSFVLFSSYAFTGIDPVGVSAIGVEFVGSLGGQTNPLIFVTSTPVGSRTNIYPKDALTALPDGSFPDSTNQYLFSWSLPAGAPTWTSLIPVEGPLALQKGAPAFEPSNTLHVWLYPQRANMIANPSFEVDNSYWAPVPARVASGAPNGGAWAGQFSNPGWLALSGATGDYVSTSDKPSLDITGDLELVAHIKPADITVSEAVILAKASEGVTRSWRWHIGPTSAVILGIWNPAGAELVATSSVVLSTAGYSDGSELWLKATFRSSDGRVQFFHAPAQATEPTTWTQLGTDRSVGAATIRVGVSVIELGSRNLGVNGLFAGRYYHAIIRSGIGGTVVASPDFTTVDPAAASLTDAQGNVWALNGTADLDFNRNVIAIESNIWETRFGESDSELWTFQLMAKGSGLAKVGLIYWDAEYRATGCDWGTETWNLTSTGWIHMAGIRRGANAHTAMLRIECNGTIITIDKVLAERGALLEWPYFDGAEKYGSPDDYSWYGGYNRQGKTYSMWYSDRRAVMGRLFSSAVVNNSPGDIVTDEEVLAAGMVYQWVPAGVTVIPHLDVFYPNDLQSVPPAKGSAVTPYYLDEAYLTPTIGTATTPDPGPLPARCVFVFKVTGPSTNSQVADQWFPSGQQSWLITRLSANGDIYIEVSVDGSTGQPAATFGWQPVTGSDEYLAASFDFNDGAGNRRYRTYVSTDKGSTYGLIATSTGASVLPFDGNAVLRIGGNTKWTGRIYSVECRTGLDPTGQAVAGATINLPGVNGNYLSVPDAANLDITGDIEIVVRLAATSWVSASPQAAFQNVECFGLTVATNGAMVFLHRTAASPGVNNFATSTAVPPNVNGQVYWWKVTRALVTGAIDFYYAADSPTEPVTWTKLGSTVTTSVNQPLLVLSSPAYIGQLRASTWMFAGRVYRAIIRNGIGGTTVLDIDSELIPNDTGTTFLAHTGQTVSVIQTADQKILQPVASQIVWRFDANEYPGTGTVYTDPRGRVWTLTNAAAIQPKVLMGVQNPWV